MLCTGQDLPEELRGNKVVGIFQSQSVVVWKNEFIALVSSRKEVALDLEISKSTVCKEQNVHLYILITI